ncbi:MAG: 50S ribosomal protein L23 [Chloroflexi bacterium]|nr:50S ribosomal protein L23 [Chloroflexota bacterium]
MTTIYDVLRRPLVTEKSNYQSGKLHQYTFEVSKDATKGLVKDAIETLFDVKVTRVNIQNVPAKRGRRARSRRVLVRVPSFKKAIVTLEAGQTLEIFEGVQ